MSLNSCFKKFSKKEKIQYTFLVDKLNHLITLYVYVLIFIITTSYQIVGKPIVCWTPAELTSASVEFITQYCWSNVAYDKDSSILVFYKWTPFFIFGLSFFFYIPDKIWLYFLRKNGLYSLILEIKTNKLKNIVLFENYLENYHRDVRSTIGNRKISINYLFLKILYFLNSNFQLIVLNEFMNRNFLRLGLDFLRFDKKFSKNFPRIGICNVTLRTLGENLHSYLIQSVLPINEIYEKVYIFIWFWLMMLYVVNFSSLIHTFTRCFTSKCLWVEKRYFSFPPDLLLIEELFELNDLRNMSEFLKI